MSRLILSALVALSAPGIPVGCRAPSRQPDDFILAIVEFLEDGKHRVHYLRQPFQREPDFGVTSVNYKLDELIARAEEAGVTATRSGHNISAQPSGQVR